MVTKMGEQHRRQIDTEREKFEAMMVKFATDQQEFREIIQDFGEELKEDEIWSLAQNQFQIETTAQLVTAFQKVCVINKNLKTDIEKRKEDAQAQADLIEKLNEEIDENKKNNEAEVAMRLKFESKLNHLHALYRDIETRYDRA
jgi:hypothetical protein